MIFRRRPKEDIMKVRILLLTIVLVLATGIAGYAGGGQEGTTDSPDRMARALPRNETLYVNGFVWGPPTNFNPLTTNSVFPVNYVNNHNLIYERLFLYNQLTDKAEPLLGTKYTWPDPMTLKVELNTAARFSDGQKVTAKDVVYSYKLGERYATPWAAYSQYLKEVVADGDHTVIFRLNPEKQNPLYMLDSITKVPIMPEHIWAKIEADNNRDFAKMIQVFNENPIGSGAYKIMYYDDTRVVTIRDENYWGTALFGTLPAPKYIAHIIYKSNDAGTNAFRQKEVDVSQQFINQVWRLWDKGEPYKTYYDEIPYYMPALLPHITFNMDKPGIGDTPEVRQAIAMAINYAKIAEVAMSNYSAPVVHMLALQTPSELDLLDTDKLKSMNYSYDVAKANALLDSIGAKKGADGIRVLPNGTRLGPWDISCPYGWSDWNASLEIVAQSVREIGIEMRTNFPEYPVWLNDMQNGNFDIGMWNTTQPGLAQPWDRSQDLLSSINVPPIGEALTINHNYGRYKNNRADEILRLIPVETDKNKLRTLYTELNEIYLKDLPHIALMYRPSRFYTVYEGIWKGFPDEKSNPNNIPPASFYGAFLKTLYSIKPVNAK
jgi:peptide/nickel transport system substrate-binding protein